MKPTKRTFLAFDERQLSQIDELKEVFSTLVGEAKAIANVELFLIAVGVGFNSKNIFPDLKKSGTGVRIQYLLPEHNLLLAGLQVAETDSAASLLDIEDLYDRAERYCAGGVVILTDALRTQRDFGEWFAAQVLQSLKAAVPD